MLRRRVRRGLDRANAAIDSLLPDRLFYARVFKRAFGRRLNFRQPRTFNEKIFWLMLYYRRPVLTRLADKYESRGYVAERIGAQYLNELYGVWDDAADIDFERLPPTFVLKVSSGFAMNIYCRDRATFDAEAARRRLTDWLRRPHYGSFREWAYKNARSRIMAERLLGGGRWLAPSNYNPMCFNGEPRYVEVHTGRYVDHRRDVFDLQWRLLPFTVNAHNFPPSDEVIPRPSNLDEMIECARRLSEGLPLLRVDFYSVEGRTVFGELTVYPTAGHSYFRPESYDRYWGDALQLPARRRWW